jgi:hypothetical protein
MHRFFATRRVYTQRVAVMNRQIGEPILPARTANQYPISGQIEPISGQILVRGFGSILSYLPDIGSRFAPVKWVPHLAIHHESSPRARVGLLHLRGSVPCTLRGSVPTYASAAIWVRSRSPLTTQRPGYIIVRAFRSPPWGSIIPVTSQIPTLGFDPAQTRLLMNRQTGEPMLRREPRTNIWPDWVAIGAGKIGLPVWRFIRRSVT